MTKEKLQKELESVTRELINEKDSKKKVVSEFNDTIKALNSQIVKIIMQLEKEH